jgi:cytochrome c peroxidase
MSRKSEAPLLRRSPARLLMPALLVTGSVMACSPAPPDPERIAQPADEVVAVVEDGLADAFARFSEEFINLGMSGTFPLGCGHHPGLSTEKLSVNGFPASAKVNWLFDTQQVFASLDGIPSGQEFDLWFVKNSAAPGKTVKPETGDLFFKVGSFDTPTSTGRSLAVTIGANVDFDLDLAVVTRKGMHPTVSRVLLGSRTLLEKRFFRQQRGLPAPSVSSPRSNAVETTDPLVQRGAQLFFNETFAGNGRTCGTCHPASNNLVIDKAFIDRRPPSDPLFVAENNPALADLEDSAQLRAHGLIRVNADGFDKPPVLRSVPHTFALGTAAAIASATGAFPIAPPDEMTGWSGEGSPGRGTLNEFAFGAIMQHFPGTLARRPGVDFRIPTQEELDALEAFQLFTGRQKLPILRDLGFADASAQSGQSLFFDQSKGRCASCHLDTDGLDASLLVNTGVAARPGNTLPPDDGFKQPRQPPLGEGRFSTPTLVEAADTPAFFHNNSADTIEQAVAHYPSAFFANSPEGQANGPIVLTPTETQDIAAFLREINAAENMRQIRKRIVFVTGHRSSGNNAILDVAIRDTDDATRDLADRNLNSGARRQLARARPALVSARGKPDASRAPDLKTALAAIDAARAALLPQNPHNDF